MKKILCLLLSLGYILCAQAGIYKHVDADGRVTYTDKPIKGAVKLDLEPPVSSSAPAGKSATAKPTPSGFPKVEKSEQKQRDDKRREILEMELTAERKALENAKLEYAEAEKNPEIFTQIVGPDGKPALGAKEGQAVIGADGKPVLGADGKPTKYTKGRGRNMAKYAEKMDKLAEEIKTHESNVQMLEQELSKL